MIFEEDPATLMGVLSYNLPYLKHQQHEVASIWRRNSLDP